MPPALQAASVDTRRSNQARNHRHFPSSCSAGRADAFWKNLDRRHPGGCLSGIRATAAAAARTARWSSLNLRGIATQVARRSIKQARHARKTGGRDACFRPIARRGPMLRTGPDQLVAATSRQPGQSGQAVALRCHKPAETAAAAEATQGMLAKILALVHVGNIAPSITGPSKVLSAFKNRQRIVWVYAAGLDGRWARRFRGFVNPSDQLVLGIGLQNAMARP